MAALHPIVHGATRWLCFVKWQIRQVLQSHNPNCAIPQKGFTGFASTTNDSRSSPTLKEEKWDDRNYRWFPLSNSQICRPFKLSEWTCKNVILNKRFGRNQVENIKRSVINDLALRADWEKTKIPWNTPIIPKRPILRCCFSAKTRLTHLVLMLPFIYPANLSAVLQQYGGVWSTVHPHGHHGERSFQVFGEHPASEEQVRNLLFCFFFYCQVC